jgi:hypothetical protein
MSYCRNSIDDSDIYLIRTIYGHYECFCKPLESFTCETPKEMFDHLMEHREDGLMVPDRALERLTKDMKVWDNE